MLQPQRPRDLRELQGQMAEIQRQVAREAKPSVVDVVPIREPLVGRQQTSEEQTNARADRWRANMTSAPAVAGMAVRMAR